MTLLLLAARIDLSQTQRVGGAILRVVDYGRNHPATVWEQAGAELAPMAARLRSLGELRGNLLVFSDPDSAEAASAYLSRMEVELAVKRAFEKYLRTPIVVYVDSSVDTAYWPETEIKLPLPVILYAQDPETYEDWEVLAKAYGVNWGVDRGKLRPGGKLISGESLRKAEALLALVRAWQGVEVPQDTTPVAKHTAEVRTQVLSRFYKYSQLAQGYLHADSAYRNYDIYSKGSPFADKLSRLFGDMKPYVDYLYDYLTKEKDILFEPAKKKLVTNPDGTQTLVKEPEKRGTRWDFIRWFLPQVVEPTRTFMERFGRRLPQD